MDWLATELKRFTKLLEHVRVEDLTEADRAQLQELQATMERLAQVPAE